MPVDERQPQRPGLDHPHQGVVDRAVAVRVQPAHHLADDAGALHVAAVGAEVHVRHRVEDPALDRLEAVPGVGQRPAVDDRVGVLEEAGAHLVADVDVEDVLLEVVGQRQLLGRAGHAASLSSDAPRVTAGARRPGHARAVDFAPVTAPSRPAAYPRHWEADVLLRDGQAAHLRPIGPDGRGAARRLLRAGVGRVEVPPVLRPDAAGSPSATCCASPTSTTATGWPSC